MKLKHLAALSALAACSSAHATLISGWDFSQYFGAGFNSTDAATFQNTLSANYSHLDPTFGAGTESAAYGTLYYNGQNGSTNVIPDGTNDAIWPTSGSLNSNLTSAQNGVTTFDRFTTLASEGQQFQNSLSLLSQGVVSLVFSGDVGSTTEGAATDWSISFASRIGSGTGSILVEFSTDGINYSTVETINVNTIDTAYSVDLSNDISAVGYTRLTLNNADIFVDNVALQGSLTAIPEPSAFAAFAGLAVLGSAFYRRRRSV